MVASCGRSLNYLQQSQTFEEALFIVHVELLVVVRVAGVPVE